MFGLDRRRFGCLNEFERSERFRKYSITVIYAGTNFCELFQKIGIYTFKLKVATA